LAVIKNLKLIENIFDISGKLVNKR